MKSKRNPTVTKPIGEDEFTAESFTELAELFTDVDEKQVELNVKTALRSFIFGRLLQRLDASCDVDGSEYFQSLIDGLHVLSEEITERSLRDMDDRLKEFFNPGTEI